MDVLDADEKPLYSYKLNKFMSSDIVQFVEFEQYKNNPKQLARQVLEEIPQQFIRHMEKHGIVPMQKDLKEQQAIREKLLNNRELTIEPLVTVEESKMNTINNPPANEENQFLDL